MLQCPVVKFFQCVTHSMALGMHVTALGLCVYVSVCLYNYSCTTGYNVQYAIASVLRALEKEFS